MKNEQGELVEMVYAIRSILSDTLFHIDIYAKGLINLCEELASEEDRTLTVEDKLAIRKVLLSDRTINSKILAIEEILYGKE